MKNPLKSLAIQIKTSIEALIKYSPGPWGASCRAGYWKGKFKNCGKRLYIGTGVAIDGARNIEIGDDVSIMERSNLHALYNGFISIGHRFSGNINVLLDASNGGKITIGNNVLIGPNVVVRASNHVYDRADIPIREQGHSGGNIIIEDDVWVGANAVITTNVVIGKGAVIAAGAVVTHNIASYDIAGGVPAVTIGKRGNQKTK
jgi:galactoside O-acetyltransferase